MVIRLQLFAEPTFFGKKLPADADWPSKATLDAELPGWEPRMSSSKLKHPDVVYTTRDITGVQRAVKFAAKYNVRLSILNSGHDFLGR